MTTNYEFGRELINCAQHKELVGRDCERMVKWAANAQPGETVKEQIRNASRNLQLDYGTVRRAWYRLTSGVEVYPTIYNAWWRLFEQRSRTRAEIIPFDPPRPPANPALRPPRRHRHVRKTG